MRVFGNKDGTGDAFGGRREYASGCKKHTIWSSAEVRCDCEAARLRKTW